MATRINFCIQCAVLIGAMVMVGALHNLEEYIIHVTHKCGPTQDDPTNLTITTDVKDLRASAMCMNTTDDNRRFIPLTDGVHHFKQILVHGNGAATDCLFHKKQNAEVYTVVLEIAYGEQGGYVNLKGDNYLVTCTYDEHGLEIYQSFPNSTSNNMTIEKSYIAPIEIIETIGVPSNGTFTIDILDIVGNVITGALALGSKVRLRGTLTNATNAVGVRVTSCIASGSSQSYQILRGGCGDGVVFPQDQGFTSTGLVTLSPYYDTFRVRGSSTIRFACNFTICEANCDGSTCVRGRRKRDLSHAMTGIFDSMSATSDDIEITPLLIEGRNENIQEVDGLVLLSKEQTPHRPVTSSTQDGVILVMLIFALLPFIMLAVGLVYLHRKLGRRHEMSVAHIEVNQPLHTRVKSNHYTHMLN